MKDYSVLAEDSGITSGLEGAIQKLIVNGLEIEDIRGGVTDMDNIQPYYGESMATGKMSQIRTTPNLAIERDEV